MTDGAKTEIYAVFESTLQNMKIIAAMFTVLNTKTAMWSLRGYIPMPKDEDEEMDNEDLLDFMDFDDILSVLKCNKWTVKKREWPSYEKRLDLMEECAQYLS